jgi:glycosyltransferase involved in cell wall biosynthesis
VAVLSPPGDNLSVMCGVRQFFVEELTNVFPSFTGHPLSPVLYYQLSEAELERVTDVWRQSFARLARTWSPTVVHTQHLWIVTTAAIDACGAVVTTCHGSELPLFDTEVGRVRRFTSSRSPRAVIYISRYVQQLARDYLPPGSLEVVLPNPYDVSHFFYQPRPSPRALGRIGFVGRLVPYKRADLFLEMVANLRPQVAGLEVWIIGDGPERTRLETLARAMPSDTHIRFVGFRPYGLMSELYRNLDVCLFCSPSEPFGLAALEAAACGTAVFVPNRGGLAELALPPHITRYSWEQPEKVLGQIGSLLLDGEPDVIRLERSRYVQRRYSQATYLDALQNVYVTTVAHATESLPEDP